MMLAGRDVAVLDPTSKDALREGFVRSIALQRYPDTETALHGQARVYIDHGIMDGDFAGWDARRLRRVAIDLTPWEHLCPKKPFFGIQCRQNRQRNMYSYARDDSPMPLRSKKPSAASATDDSSNDPHAETGGLVSATPQWNPGSQCSSP
jgi:hypothetical protein